jgi:hypothetical protein
MIDRVIYLERIFSFLKANTCFCELSEAVKQEFIFDDANSALFPFNYVKP